LIFNSPGPTAHMMYFHHYLFVVCSVRLHKVCERLTFSVGTRCFPHL